MPNELVMRRGERVEEPRFVQFLLNDPKAAWFWLVARVWLGWQWIEAGWHKIEDPAWTRTGEAIQGYWAQAVAIPDAGRPAISFDWYRAFLQTLIDTEAHTWFAPLIAYSELLVGVALILGALTGFAALAGAVMNWNFMMAGSASSNPVLLVLAIGLIMAWKVAGYIGLDYLLLRYVGTPWHGERVVTSPTFASTHEVAIPIRNQPTIN